MPIRVQVPGHGIVEFPDGTPEAEMSAALDSLAASAKPATPSVSAQDLLEHGPSAMGPGNGFVETAKAVGSAIKNHPATAGAMAASALAAPFTGGLSLLPEMAALGAAGAAGAAAGNAAAGRPIGEGVVREGLTSASGPLAGKAMKTAGDFLSRTALRSARAAIKTPVSILRQQAGASITGNDAQANRMASIILRNRWSKPEQAIQAVKDAEIGIRAALKNAPEGTTLDVGGRLPRYLKKLELSAGEQARPDRDLASIQDATQGVLNGPLGRDIQETVTRPSTVLGPNGKPLGEVSEQVAAGRAFRDDVTPTEGLKIARATGRWDNRKEWGELKGAEQEVSKATERALRDEVKHTVKSTAPFFKQQSEALAVAPVLDAMKVRQGNRDVVGLPAYIALGGGGNMVNRGIGALLAQSIRNGQLRGAFGMDTLGPALVERSGKTATLTPYALRALLVGLMDGGSEESQQEK